MWKEIGLNWIEDFYIKKSELWMVFYEKIYIKNIWKKILFTFKIGIKKNKKREIRAGISLKRRKYFIIKC